MPTNDRLVAWIEPRGQDEFVAAFVSAAMRPRRLPATQVCPSLTEARHWVEDQATALGGVPVDWVERPRGD